MLGKEGAEKNVTTALDEPEEICPESVFQSALVRVLEEISGDWSTVLVQSFGLDVAMFLNGPGGGKVRFLEFKSFGGQRMGGVGFSNQRGEGPQVDLLLNEQQGIALLDSFVRWVFALKFDSKLRPLPRGAGVTRS